MKSFDKLPVGVQALVALLCLFAAGLIYYANKLLWVGVWAILPFASYLLIRRMRLLDDHLTEKGMKTLHIWCTSLMALLSFTLFMDRDLHHRFAHHFFGGRVWVADEGDSDDYGYPVATTEYDAPSSLGRFAIGAYPWAIAGTGFVLSFATHFSFVDSIRAKEEERQEAERQRYLRKQDSGGS